MPVFTSIIGTLYSLCTANLPGVCFVQNVQTAKRKITRVGLKIALCFVAKQAVLVAEQQNWLPSGRLAFPALKGAFVGLSFVGSSDTMAGSKRGDGKARSVM
jgi:hypothetical protein